LLWLFVSVELVLQTTRLFLVRVSDCTTGIWLSDAQVIEPSARSSRQNRAQPPGILNSILPVVSQFSPQLALAIQTGVRYLSLLSILVTDLSVLIFCIGVFAVVGKWKTGGHAVLIQEAGEAWEHIKEDL
jgi:NADH:ubiquinone oxidoreductase subunit K